MNKLTNRANEAQVQLSSNIELTDELYFMKGIRKLKIADDIGSGFINLEISHGK